MKRKHIKPAVTTTEDVEWAYRALLGRDPGGLDAERLRRHDRTLLELRHRILNSAAFNGEKHRQRCSKALDAEHVRWAYRLLRFEEIGDDESLHIAETHPTMISLLDEMLAADDLDAIVEAARPRQQAGVRYLYIISMPRSGHHLLADMLQEYFASKLRYCEFYGGDDQCCHSMPCKRAYHPLLDNQWMTQKNHDFQFEAPTDLPGKYVIQYRHPIPRMQSNFDHNVHASGQDDSVERFRSFIKVETQYFIRFYDKWMRAPNDNWFLLAYEDLISTPRAAFTRLLHFIDGSVNEEAVENAFAIIRKPSPSSLQRSGNYVPRNVGEYRYYDSALYRAVEDEIFAACPGLHFERMFP